MSDIQSRFKAAASSLLKQHKKLTISHYNRQVTINDTTRFQQLIQQNNFARELFGLSNRLCTVYENSNWHSIVLEVLDLEVIYSNVDSEVAKIGDKDDKDEQYSDILVKELLRYFKQDFFKWLDKPDCPKCGQGSNQNMSSNGVQRPNQEEAQHQCGAVEIYRCNNCGTESRFPRYNDPIKLLETRVGRCGEWCNLFTLILKSFGLEARYIWNREDHVWCEYYSNYLKRWVHLDSCEQSFDQPYIYSKNWNKKMSYCIAFSRYGVQDVSKRYILQNQLPRDTISEDSLLFFCNFITKKLRISLSNDELYQLLCRDEAERLSWVTQTKNLTSDKTSEEAFKGRSSGSKEWKKERGEDGS
ncbi:hypothetical protein TBLA_0H03830 [Henningerozyma blattae CBS 6284]|uniref:Peptide-N(4)-(N-acetyl-beta-glucosaminyl)asparagine amidase n=1 Tax=Henningerozyma blattae (strain ATCC 34711 / CBS 6284 / DSM 70876 / NBRC 10599 / NRRL Y-10934 / UCD 77-7) TaxID=1071380 RepID=I2H8G2_HENB6|nr:hypothetical protein TBLA_0H03830 [Tetrapisispora blattae CBS 6284]CCH62664.1 hypothetical protein TBLA_0H03830 [Tetrapisispora blattae CBS 6284]